MLLVKMVRRHCLAPGLEHVQPKSVGPATQYPPTTMQLGPLQAVQQRQTDGWPIGLDWVAV
jgi:hypothetical protein